MMIFGTRTKALQRKNQDAVGNCNYCGTLQALYPLKVIKYFHIFWIPIFPYGSQLTTHCTHCKKVSYQAETPPETLANIRRAGIPKTPLGYFAGLIIIALFVGSAFVAGIAASASSKNYLADPKPGDIYEIKNREGNKNLYTLYRIANVAPDSITFDINDYEAEGVKGLRKLRKSHANSFSEKLTLSRADVKEMNTQNHISKIKRK